METKSYMERLENVLDGMGLKTFERPLTVDYRFGSFESTLGVFHCFVHEDEIERTGNYMEIRSDRVYWVALEYPGFEEFFKTLVKASVHSSKVMGRLHSVTFILALEEGLPAAERERLMQAFEAYRNSLSAGTYNVLKIWDDAALRELEKRAAARKD